MTVEYNDILTEKACLSKDLSRLRVELERLKTESDSLPVLLNEKKVLERELKSEKTQLENEKNAREYAEAEILRQTEKISMLSGQLEDARRKLAVDSHSRQQRGTDYKSPEWKLEQSVFEKRKGGLYSTKKRHRQVGHGLQQFHNGARTDDLNSAKPRVQKIPREQAAVSADMTIATPGAVQFREKAKKSPRALPGEKSTFSITPFLNRTNSFQSSPTPSTGELDEVNTTITGPRFGTFDNSANTSGDEGSHNEPREEVLSLRGPILDQGLVSDPGLSKITERERKKGHLSPSGLQGKFYDQPPGKAKKRKLGAQRDRSILDDDDEDEILGMRRPGRKLSIFEDNQPTFSGEYRQNRGLGFTAAGFSPLKRDRRRRVQQ